MSNLSIRDNALVLNLDTVYENNTLIRSFLERIHFIKIDNEFINTSTNYSVITQVQNLFQRLSWPLTLDDPRIQQIIQDFENQRRNFENLCDDAERIKNTPDDQLNIPRIPRFLDTIHLQPTQIKPILHGLALGNSANFSVPGAGKTWMAYAQYFLLREKPEPDNIHKLLVICPLSAFMAWEREYTRLTGDEQHRNIIRIEGNENQKRQICQRHAEEIFLINFEKTRNDMDRQALKDMMDECKQNGERFLLILDESHKIKNFDSQQSAAVRELAIHAHKRMILTGTPMPTRWDDLWNQFNFLFPDDITNLLGTYANYQTRVDTDIDGIRENLRPTWTRVTKAQLGLEIVAPHVVQIPMTDIQETIYDIVAQQVLYDAEQQEWVNALEEYSGFIWLIEVATDPSLIRKSNHFHQELFDIEGLDVEAIIDNYSQHEKPGKIDAIEKLLSADWFTKRREKVIIWCNFVSTMEKIDAMLEAGNYGERRLIYGKTSSQKETFLDDFMNRDDCNILIANPASLSESVSLHRQCHRAIYVDRTYNAAHWMQSKERIYRVGSTHLPVYTILCSEYQDHTITIDELIRQRLQQHENNMNTFLDSEDIQVHDMDIRYDEEQQDIGANQDDLRNLLESIRRRLND